MNKKYLCKTIAGLCSTALMLGLLTLPVAAKEVDGIQPGSTVVLGGEAGAGSASSENSGSVLPAGGAEEAASRSVASSTEAPGANVRDAVASAGGESIPAGCSCTQACRAANETEDGVAVVNPECPVCGAENADLALCAGAAAVSTAQLSPTANGHDIGVDGSLVLTPNDGCTEATPHVVTGTTTQNNIAVQPGTHYIQLQDVEIILGANSILAAIDLGPAASVFLLLPEGTSSELRGGGGFAGIGVREGASLTISGGGKLGATGTGAAGIGGDTVNPVGGTINILGGELYAVSLVRSSDEVGAGIGGGNNGANGTVNIEGGAVVATGNGDGAGIGGGPGGAGGTIHISGGTVTGTSNRLGAGIGGGEDGAGGDISITDGVVVALARGYGAGIGGGDSGAGGSISITGGRVNAASEDGGAGIGGGQYAEGGLIEISGGTVTTTAKCADPDLGGAGIGGGSGVNGKGGTITITGGLVVATSNAGGAGIGSGTEASGGDITITGGQVYALNTGEGFALGTSAKGEGASSLTLTGMLTWCPVDGGAYTGETNVVNNRVYEGTDQSIEAKNLRIVKGYTITLDPQGGSVTPTTMKTDEEGKLRSAMPTPTHETKTFMGWFDAATGGNRLEDNAVFSQDITAYAQWNDTSSSESSSSDSTTPTPPAQNTTPTSPQTGDTLVLWPLMALAVVALLGGGAVLFAKLRGKKKSAESGSGQ